MTAALRIIEGGQERRVQPHDPAKRGYVVQYEGSHTPCPGCGRKNWLVGRQSAECGFCATALPLTQPKSAGDVVI